MKKIWTTVGVIVLTIAVSVGSTLGIKALVDKNKNEDANALAVESSVIFDNEQTEDTAYLRAWAVGETDFTKITYQIDTGAEVVVSTHKKGKVTEDWQNYDAEYKDMYYIDTGNQMINISSLAEGKHIITICVYDGDAKDVICEEVFTVKAVS